MREGDVLDEKVVFGATFEAFLRATAPLTPSEDAAIRALKITPGGPYQVGYPLETWTALLAAVAKERYPKHGELEAYTELGRSLIRGYDQTIIGKAMIAVMKLIGPRRALQRMTRNFRNGNNYSDFKVTELGPNEAELWCNYVVKPGFYRGVMLEGLTVAGAKELSVDFVKKDGDAAVYRLRWV